MRAEILIVCSRASVGVKIKRKGEKSVSQAKSLGLCISSCVPVQFRALQGRR